MIKWLDIYTIVRRLPSNVIVDEHSSKAKMWTGIAV
jgi:hypothetical protein